MKQGAFVDFFRVNCVRNNKGNHKGNNCLLYTSNLGITIFVFLLTGMMLFSQILFIIFAMFLPISFLPVSYTHLGKLREVAVQKIDEQTEALVSMIGDNQVDYRFFLGFKLMVTSLPVKCGFPTLFLKG